MKVVNKNDKAAVTDYINLLYTKLKEQDDVSEINKTEDTVPQGKRFATYFVNIGMIAFFIYWIAMIIYQLFR